jgi:hydrogenase/urease accessory protein HupE
MRSITRLTALAITAACLTYPAPARAHGMRSAYLEIDELEGADPLVRLRVTQPDVAAIPSIEGCELTPLHETHLEVDGMTRGYRARCRRPLAGATVTVSGLGVELEEAVVRVRSATGELHSAVLTSGNPRLRIPAHGDAEAAWWQYLRLGTLHILGGADHLLFLLLIVLHLRRLRPILVAETAFSLSHGLAFAATVTGWIRVPAAPVEAAIALSLVLLALDVGRAGALSARATAAMALVFGAVHGLGFAGGLRELGVPERQLGPAVLGFGVGVELGQLGFVLTTWCALTALARWRGAERVARWLVLIAGSLAMSWLLTRGLIALEAT